LEDWQGGEVPLTMDIKKEMILASSQRATLLMHEHCTNVGECQCSYHFFEEAALWDFQKY